MTMLRLTAALILAAAFVSTAVNAAENAPAPTSRTPKLSDLFGDDVIARGKNVEVKRSQLEDAFTAFKANLASNGRQMREDQRLAQESQLLERLIVTQVLTNMVTDADRKIAKDISDKFIADAKKNGTSEEAFNRQLKAMGLSPEQFNRRVTEQSLVEAIIQREVTANIKITDAQIQDFYTAGTDLLVRLLQADLDKMLKDPAAPPALTAQVKERIIEVKKANLSRLEQPERVKVSHVFMTTMDRQTEEPLPAEQKKFKHQQMEKIRKRALDGEDFARLIQEFSEDRGVKQTKGEYTFSRDDGFAPEFKAAAFSLMPGKVSDVVSTTIGLHVIKLLEKIPAKKIGLEKISQDLKEFLSQQEVQRAMPEYFARVKQGANVEILDPKYRAALGSGPEPKKMPLEPAPGSNVKSEFVPVKKP